MILCITPNAAIDRTMIVPRLEYGHVHRAEQSIIAAGGKGLNVARAIHTLGGEALCMGFVGGHTGHLLADLAQQEGLDSSWIWTKAETRTCTILVSHQQATVINEPGMPVSKSDWKRLQRKVRQYVSAETIACVSGSLPPKSSPDDLRRLLGTLLSSCKQVWVDTSGDALDTALTVPGVCIKVNDHEIGTSLGLEVNDVRSAKRALGVLHERGISAGVITLGAAGAVLATKEGKWYAKGPQVKVISAIGSGDSFLGGLVSAWDAGEDWPECLRSAVAAGTANTLSAGGGQFSLREFRAIRDQVQVQSW